MPSSVVCEMWIVLAKLERCPSKDIGNSLFFLFWLFWCKLILVLCTFETKPTKKKRITTTQQWILFSVFLQLLFYVYICHKWIYFHVEVIWVLMFISCWSTCLGGVMLCKLELNLCLVTSCVCGSLNSLSICRWLHTLGPGGSASSCI